MQNHQPPFNNFETIYISYYPKLKRFAQEYVIDEAEAENIVQDIFLMLWKKKELFTVDFNIRAYLFTTVKNKCIDFLRHKIIMKNAFNRMQEEYELTLQMKFQSLEEFNEQIFNNADIEKIINDAIQSLPEKCRQIFVMNKIEGKKQKTIAEELHISVNTIENQMAIAYRKLKEILNDYFPLLLFFFL